MWTWRRDTVVWHDVVRMSSGTIRVKYITPYPNCEGRLRLIVTTLPDCTCAACQDTFQGARQPVNPPHLARHHGSTQCTGWQLDAFWHIAS